MKGEINSINSIEFSQNSGNVGLFGSAAVASGGLGFWIPEREPLRARRQPPEEFPPMSAPAASTAAGPGAPEAAETAEAAALAEAIAAPADGQATFSLRP